MRLLLTVSFFFLASSSFAQNVKEEPGYFETNARHEVFWMPNSTPATIYTRFKNRLRQGEPQIAPVPTERSSQCREAYRKLYNKADVHWSVFFGYADENESLYTTDFAEKDLFERELTMDCPTDSDAIQLCGFSIEDLAEARYVKSIKTKENTLVNVHLRLYNSSLTSEKKLNQNREQKEKSNKIEAAYLQALVTDDIVFFSGHARNGSGPGMRPMTHKSKDWWTALLFRPWIRNIELALDPRESEVSFTGHPKSPSLIGLFLCDGEAHYGEEFARHAPESALLLTRQTITADDSVRLLYASSNSLLAEDCEDDFQSHMNAAIDTVFYRKKEGPIKNLDTIRPKIFNFFHPDRVHGKNDIVEYFRNKDEVQMPKPNAP